MSTPIVLIPGRSIGRGAGVSSTTTNGFFEAFGPEAEAFSETSRAFAGPVTGPTPRIREAASRLPDPTSS
jgi:hypothetical protein